MKTKENKEGKLLDKPNFRVSLPHRRSTTVSSETNPLDWIQVWRTNPTFYFLPFVHSLRLVHLFCICVYVVIKFTLLVVFLCKKTQRNLIIFTWRLKNSTFVQTQKNGIKHFLMPTTSIDKGDLRMTHYVPLLRHDVITITFWSRYHQQSHCQQKLHL